MSHTAAALATVLDALNWSQTELAEWSGIDRSMLNRYVRGTSPLGIDNLSRLLTVIPTPHNSVLLAAYLRDAVPHGSESLVTILANSAAREEPEALPADLEPALRSALVRLIQRANRHREVRDMLLQLDRALRA